jgi:hypothetical protein
MEAMMDRARDGGVGLDPARDPARWEALVGGIVQSATPELERRRGQVTLTAMLVDWARPALSAAAAIAVLLSVSLALTRGGVSAEGDPSLANALVPDALAAWLVDGYQPTVTEVVVALEQVVR